MFLLLSAQNLYFAQCCLCVFDTKWLPIPCLILDYKGEIFMSWIFIILILILVAFVLEGYGKKINSSNSNSFINFSNYHTNNYLMTQTELIFYRQLKTITDNLQLSIFPQVNLERIIQTTTNSPADRNRIKSRSIDYTIVNNKNCKVLCCIELDVYTHYREKNKQVDEFKDNLFKEVEIPLYLPLISGTTVLTIPSPFIPIFIIPVPLL